MARILVIGGGTGGTATALALHKAGFDVEVHEAHPDSAEDLGAFLTLAGNGMRALAQIDATDAVTAIGFPLRSMRLLDAKGAEVANGPLGEADDPLLRFRCLRRGDLNSALQKEASRRGVPVRHGVRLASVEEGPDSVTARFTDGSSATGDLLIGADGVNSTVRKAIAPDVRPVYAAQRVFYGMTRDARPPGEDGQFTMVRCSEAAFGYTVSPDGETYWFARVTDDPLTAEELTRGGWRDPLVSLLRRDTGPAADIVAATGPGAGEVLVTNATEIPPGTPWRSARTLLVGDAAHAASPRPGRAPRWPWRTPSCSRSPCATRRTPAPGSPCTRRCAARVWSTTRWSAGVCPAEAGAVRSPGPGRRTSPAPRLGHGRLRVSVRSSRRGTS